MFCRIEVFDRTINLLVDDIVNVYRRESIQIKPKYHLYFYLKRQRITLLIGQTFPPHLFLCYFTCVGYEMAPWQRDKYLMKLNKGNLCLTTGGWIQWHNYVQCDFLASFQTTLSEKTRTGSFWRQTNTTCSRNASHIVLAR